jgi:hypothetical protein
MRGAEAVRAWMEPDALEMNHVEPREFRINGNRVLVRQHSQARGAGSGIELDFDTWAVWTFDDDGLITRLESFLIHEGDKASEAVGLSG